MGSGGDLQKEQQVVSLCPDDLKGVGAQGDSPRRYLRFSKHAPCPAPSAIVTHTYNKEEALGTDEVTGPEGQSGWAGGQHSSSKAQFDRALGPLGGDLAVKTTEDVLGLCFSFYYFCPGPPQWGRGGHGRWVPLPPA